MRNDAMERLMERPMVMGMKPRAKSPMVTFEANHM